MALHLTKTRTKTKTKTKLCPLEHEGGDEGFLCRRHLVPRQPDPPDLPELKTQGTSCRLVQAFHIHQEVELRLMKYFSTKKNKI